MGLHLCYELQLRGNVPDAAAAERVSALHERALGLPFDHVVQLTERALAGPWPLRGLAYDRLEDVAHVSAVWARAELHRRQLGIPDEDEDTRVDVPPDVPTLAYAFAVAPGRGCGAGHLRRRAARRDEPQAVALVVASVLQDPICIRAG